MKENQLRLKLQYETQDQNITLEKTVAKLKNYEMPLVTQKTIDDYFGN